MKLYEAEREMGVLGRVGIPAEIYRHLLIEPGTKLQIWVENDTIMLRPKQSACDICHKRTGVFLFEVGSKNVCDECAEQIEKIRGAKSE